MEKGLCAAVQGCELVAAAYQTLLRARIAENAMPGGSAMQAKAPRQLASQRSRQGTRGLSSVYEGNAPEGRPAEFCKAPRSGTGAAQLQEVGAGM